MLNSGTGWTPVSRDESGSLSVGSCFDFSLLIRGSWRSSRLGRGNVSGKWTDLTKVPPETADYYL